MLSYASQMDGEGEGERRAGKLHLSVQQVVFGDEHSK